MSHSTPDNKQQDNSENSGNYLTEQYLGRLKNLSNAIESGQTLEANNLISELTTMRESALFQELGKLTREIHESINSFSQDDRVAELAQDEIPDAKERLNYIITKTDEAAHRTMTGAEEAMDIMREVSNDSNRYKNLWQQFRNRELSKEDFVQLNSDIGEFLQTIEEKSTSVNSKMTDILMAQDYQDITGQMIKQVIKMVQEIEDKLVRLVALSGAKMVDTSVEEKPWDGTMAHGPQLPSSSSEDVANNQDDVDELLASLGF